MAGVWVPTLRLYWRDFWIRVLFLCALGIDVAAFGALAWLRPTQDIVALHYNVYFGIDLLGSRGALWWLPVVALTLTIFNIVTALFVWRRDRVLSYFVAAGTVFCAAIVLAATILMAVVNR